MIEKFGISVFLALLVGAPLGLALSLAGLPLLFPSILAVGIGSYVWLGRSATNNQPPATDQSPQ